MLTTFQGTLPKEILANRNMHPLSNEDNRLQSFPKESPTRSERVVALTTELDNGSRWAVCPHLSFWFGDVPEGIDPALKECIVALGQSSKYVNRVHRWAKFRRMFKDLEFREWIDVPFSRGRVVVVKSCACVDLLKAAFPQI